MESSGWLLFLYTLRSGASRQRVQVWRKLKKFGALPFKTSASLLPDAPVHFERFQWLAKQIQDGGGDATLVRVDAIEGMSRAQIIHQFNAVRAEDYDALIHELNALIKANRRKIGTEFDVTLERVQVRLLEVEQIDFFHSPRAQDARMLFEKAAGLRKRPSPAGPRLKREAHQGRKWLTRPRPEIDRVGSAWLIKTQIDPKARFVFATSPADEPTAIPYDMANVELTHQGDDCTFETLLKRFDLQDQALHRIAEMIHDADLDDEKFHTSTAEGIDRVLKGLARLGWADEKILRHGFVCFDGLYAQVKAS